MEGIFFRGVWTNVILIILTGAHCNLCNDIQLYICPKALDSQTQPIAATGAEAGQLFECSWAGSDINKNKAMVEQLKTYGVITSEKVADVIESIDRALFVPDGNVPYYDSPMPIGYNVTISAPHMHATCLQLLEENLQPGMHALDVGSGTGYLTACFALMVGPQGRVVGVEHIPELVSSSIQNIQKGAAAPLLKEGSLSVHVGDGRLGWPEHAPYDAIHVGAAAPEIPQALVDQLKPGGRMVIPVGTIFQELKVIDKNLDGSLSIRDEISVRYVPLTSRDVQLQGV
ncbi:protein-L-isoaspartate O-methyltransferase 1-like [Juglans microcarpa x Juglans regia]|uniref:protein-L-isoaspartate O-methyltransferase 1-like n=1 Tax=Juglans microcarpa x Juglans regia TaxID=2249226 RepID=UPI001B7DA934|nr:protein-L-isoaspartate O-methyltransferase 1-like [Juglans microcarpa x Juglans regia]